MTDLRYDWHHKLIPLYIGLGYALGIATGSLIMLFVWLASK